MGFDFENLDSKTWIRKPEFEPWFETLI